MGGKSIDEEKFGDRLVGDYISESSSVIVKIVLVVVSAILLEMVDGEGGGTGMCDADGS